MHSIPLEQYHTDYQYINLQSYFPRISKIKASRSIGRLFLYICPKVKL
uniref:Uncharacterized protein n=1 Tax=Siphoviridae sp. ctbrg2 TaxID=2823589 RepID=A0A8S5LG53_9CAUD|nr:MAG TPA: hypothetical protein [Siphoviridae sp. ctbrg2]